MSFSRWQKLSDRMIAKVALSVSGAACGAADAPAGKAFSLKYRSPAWAPDGRGCADYDGCVALGKRRDASGSGRRAAVFFLPPEPAGEEGDPGVGRPDRGDPMAGGGGVREAGRQGGKGRGGRE